MVTTCAPVADQQGAWAAALLDPGRRVPDGWRAWNGSDPARRFAVHRNNVVSSLVDALAAAFPVAQALVGDEFFRAMASVFVRRHPPASAVLALYGRDFPGFVARFEPAAAVPCLAGVARLEFARLRAFHAADAPVAGAAALGRAAAAGPGAAAMCLVLHPSVTVWRSRYAGLSIWAAHQVDAPSRLGEIHLHRPEQALVVRSGDDVLVLPVTAAQAEFLARFLAGACLANASAAAQDADPAFDLTATLVMAAGHDAIKDLQLSQEALE